jgi:hypothetical protein
MRVNLNTSAETTRNNCLTAVAAELFLPPAGILGRALESGFTNQKKGGKMNHT